MDWSKPDTTVDASVAQQRVWWVMGAFEQITFVRWSSLSYVALGGIEMDLTCAYIMAVFESTNPTADGLIYKSP